MGEGLPSADVGGMAKNEHLLDMGFPNFDEILRSRQYLPSIVTKHLESVPPVNPATNICSFMLEPQAFSALRSRIFCSAVIII